MRTNYRIRPDGTVAVDAEMPAYITAGSQAADPLEWVREPGPPFTLSPGERYLVAPTPHGEVDPTERAGLVLREVGEPLSAAIPDTDTEFPRAIAGLANLARTPGVPVDLANGLTANLLDWAAEAPEDPTLSAMALELAEGTMAARDAETLDLATPTSDSPAAVDALLDRWADMMGDAR